MDTIMNKPFPLYYETLGDPQNPCLLLVNGLGGQLILWPQSFIEGLVKLGFFVVTFDNRDVGLSRYYDEYETPDLLAVVAGLQQGQTFQPPYTLRDMAADVISLLDQLHIRKVHLVGISFGGIITQLVACEYPERVLSLTCIGSTSNDPSLPPAKPEVRAYFLSPQKKEDSAEVFVANKMNLHRLYLHPDHIDEEKDSALFTKLYQRAYHPAGFKRQLLAMLAAGSLVPQLKNVSAPSLIIHGDQDPAFPLEHGKQLAALIPHAHLEVIQNLGHGLPECLCGKILQLMSRFYFEREKFHADQQH